MGPRAVRATAARRFGEFQRGARHVLDFCNFRHKLALPKAYLTTQKNLDGILAAIQTARAPRKFTQQFLSGLGFKSSSDRLIINVLKSLGFLSPGGEPTQRYFEFLDQTQSDRVMAEALLEAYEDLFELSRRADTLSRSDLKNKMRTLSQGQVSDSVLDKMAMTFQALAKHADLASTESAPVTSSEEADSPGDAEMEPPAPESPAPPEAPALPLDSGGALSIDGLVYNIQIQLPESRDPAVYDAIFRSLKIHLLR